MSSTRYVAGQLTADTMTALENGKLNPLTGMDFSRAFRDRLPLRRKLPVFTYRGAFLSLMHEPDTKVVILTGATGSGKSTQLPALLLVDLFKLLKNTKKKIACTEPRRMAARGLGMRVALEMGVTCGKTVAFSYRDAALDGPGAASDDSLLVYSTDGILLAYALANPGLDDYAVVFFDEAHERTPATDLLLAIAKRAQQTRGDLKIVVMSATISVKGFQQYLPGSKTMEIPGRNFPMTAHFLTPDAFGEPIDIAVKLAVRLHLTEPSGAILIFVKSKKEIAKVMGALGGQLEDLKDCGFCGLWELIPLHAKLPQAAQDKVLAPPPLAENANPGRQIIVSTNVAETSVTVPGLVYVIDTCEVFEKVDDPRSGTSRMNRRNATKQEMMQRRGRAGRTRPGKYYACITASAYFRYHADATLPGMLIQKPLDVVYQILGFLEKNPRAAGHAPGELFNFGLVDPPAAETVMRCLQELHYLNLIDTDGTLSIDGKKLSGLAIGPCDARMVLRSGPIGCCAEIITIVAMREVLANHLELHIKPWSFSDEDELAREAERLSTSEAFWKHPRGVLIGSVAVYNSWRSISVEDQDAYCEFHMLSKRFLLGVDAARKRIARSVTKLPKFKITRMSQRDPLYFDTISRGLCTGMFMSAAIRSPAHDLEKAAAFVTFKDQRKLYWEMSEEELENLDSTSDFDYIVHDEPMLNRFSYPIIKMATPVKLSWLIEASAKAFDPEAMPPGKMREGLVKIISAITNSSEESANGKR
ncbi:unnamed protein product [Zymoseptoria tritici ST99CH_1A5]|uniref:RNA helicase n=1 Tax=Zymoseptoria tritici ST99CH_1A5 TaxID=1276529 RepID=A0A1Y6LI04_ZYMTR|nr:unnamed protein product [Zymoseptoria tritici ST99CH_1A5]